MYSNYSGKRHASQAFFEKSHVAGKLYKKALAIFTKL
jgi:hypothetical protein